MSSRSSKIPAPAARSRRSATSSMPIKDSESPTNSFSAAPSDGARSRKSSRAPTPDAERKPSRSSRLPTPDNNRPSTSSSPGPLYTHSEKRNIPTHLADDHDTAELVNIKKQEIDIQGEINPYNIAALIAKAKRKTSVIEIGGNVEKKMVLTYKKPPAPEPEPVKKKKKKDKEKIKMKSKGMLTDPPPITVNSGTWTTPTTFTTQQTTTTHVCLFSQGVQSEGVSTTPRATMTRPRQCLDVGISAAMDYSDVGTEAVPFKTTMVSRSVGSAIPKPAVSSNGMNHKPEVQHQSVEAAPSTRSQACHTEKLGTGDKETTAAPETQDSACCPMPPVSTAQGVQATPTLRVRSCSTSDLIAFKDSGVSTIRTESQVRSTMTELKTHRHMAVGTKNTDTRKIGKLESELEKMQRHRRHILKVTKDLMENQEKAKRVLQQKPPTGRMRRTPSSSSSICSYSSCQCKAGAHPPQNILHPLVYQRSEACSTGPGVICSCLLCKQCHDKIHIARRRYNSAFTSSPSQLCPDTCRCAQCFPQEEGKVRVFNKSRDLYQPRTATPRDLYPSRDQRPRRRVHSMVILESKEIEEYRGREVRVRTPSNYDAVLIFS